MRPDPHFVPPADRKVYRSLSSPGKIQDYLDNRVGYNNLPNTCYSPHTVIERQSGHCMEGALLAAAALRILGYQPLLVDLEAVRDTDHVLAVFRGEDGCWGAVAKSNYAGIRFRTPIYRTIRELAISYFEHYYNPKGEKTLRGYSRPVNLRRFDGLKWMSTSEELWPIPMYLARVPHKPILLNGSARYFMDRRLYDAGRVGLVE